MDNMELDTGMGLTGMDPPMEDIEAVAVDPEPAELVDLTDDGAGVAEAATEHAMMQFVQSRPS
eukprot:753828-Alexandrium_andersonii.AAC.1